MADQWRAVRPAGRPRAETPGQPAQSGQAEHQRAVATREPLRWLGAPDPHPPRGGHRRPERRRAGGVRRQNSRATKPRLPSFPAPRLLRKRLSAAAATLKEEPVMSETLTVATIETIELDKVIIRRTTTSWATRWSRRRLLGVHTKRRSRISRSQHAGRPVSRARQRVRHGRAGGGAADKRLDFLARDKARRSGRLELITQGHHRDQFMVIRSRVGRAPPPT